jgi:hypothetical protein
MVAVFRVVPRQCQIAEGVKPSLLHALPIAAKRLSPLGREILVLGHDVLDGVVIDWNSFLASKVLKAPQPIASSWEIV